METKVNYAIVGAFVITLLMGLIITIVWLSAGFSHKNYNSYLVYMDESVAGLNIDSPVRYNGVAVGFVKKIALNPKNPQQVRLLLNIEEHTPITEDTRATLNVQGLTGVAFLSLKSIGPSTKLLLKQPGQHYPVIPTAPSLLTRLDTVITDLSTNLNQISKSVQAILDTDNQHTIKETLQNLNQITASLAANSKSMSTILQNTAKASQQFPAVMQAFTNQTLPAANQLISSLQSVGDNLTVITSEIKQNPSVMIRGKTPPSLGPGEK